MKQFYRNLNPNNTKMYHRLNEFADSFRNQIRGGNNDETSLIYGLIAEETALFLLRMYQTQFPMEIIDSLIFEYAEGMTTETDLIAVTPNMLYVIECKHRSQDMALLGDGTIDGAHGIEDPIGQNIGHIKRILQNSGYSNTIPFNRILNVVYLTLNNCKVNNPQTVFKKEVLGAFAGINNLLSLIHKFETEKGGGRIPYKKVAENLRKLGKDYQGRAGMEAHLDNLEEMYGDVRWN